MNEPAQSELTSKTQEDLEALDVTDREYWEDGPPHEIFTELRGRCPVHWSEINEYPDEEGFWSVTKAKDVREVSLDWETYSSERGGCDLVNDVAQPVVSRVIGSFMGIPEEDDAIWARIVNSSLGLGDEDLNPGGLDQILEQDIPE